MYSSGNVTVMVSDMNRAVQFYTETLGLHLTYRHANDFATVELDKGLTIGLHPGGDPTKSHGGGLSIGLELSGSIREAVAQLEAKGVQFQGGIREGKSGAFAHFTDPDGNPIYLAQLNWRHVEEGEGKYQTR